LIKQGNNLYTTNDAAVAAAPIDDFNVVQGMIEESNVNSTKELTTMIAINRAVGSTAKFINDVHDLQRKSISTISKMQ
jgi:flagellar basal body rod protein FlgG